MAVLLTVVAVVLWAPLLPLVATFVYVGTGAEFRVTVLRDLPSGMAARELMSADVGTVAPEQRDSTTVADVMVTAPPAVGAHADDFAALRSLSESRGDRVFVTEDGRLLGRITSAEFVTAIELLQSLGASRDVEVPEGYA